jgi:hypothetical protein
MPFQFKDMPTFRSMLCLTAPRKLHRREGEWVQKYKAFLGIRRETSGLHVSMAPIETWPSLSLCNDYLCFAAYSLSLLLHVDECEFINPLPSSFVLRLYLPYLPAGSGFLIRSCIHSTYVQDFPVTCTLLLSLLLSPFASLLNHLC